MSLAPRPTEPQASGLDARAEHDALARQLEVRRSIDHVRVAWFLGFASIIAFGMSCKLAWDRWGPPEPGVEKVIPPGGPLFFIVACVVTAVLVAFGLRAWMRARRLMREEDALFARFRALREALGLDR